METEIKRNITQVISKNGVCVVECVSSDQTIEHWQWIGNNRMLYSIYNWILFLKSIPLFG